MKKTIALVLVTGIMSASAAFADKGAASAQTVLALSTTSTAPLGTTTALYCDGKTNYDNGDSAREVFKRFTKCLVGMFPDWGKGTTDGIKWTGKNIVTIPDATKGTSDGTTEGLSGKEEKAVIQAAQEDLMGVAAGGEASAIAEGFMKIQFQGIAQEQGLAAAQSMSKEELAASTVRELEQFLN